MILLVEALSLEKGILLLFFLLLSLLGLSLINFLEVKLFLCWFLFGSSCLLEMLYNFFIDNFSYSFLFVSRFASPILKMELLGNSIFYLVFQVEQWTIFIPGLKILFVVDFTRLNFGIQIFIFVVIYFINWNLIFVII